MNYKTLILDFDGTIADTQDSILQTMKVTADKLNIKPIDEEKIKSLIGLPLKSTFQKAFHLNEDIIEDAISVYRTHYNNIAKETIFLFDDVKETLYHFYSSGINLTIASSKKRSAIIEILKQQNILDVFSFVGGEEDVNNKKPSPDIVNLILNKYNCLPNESLVVGDTIFDIEMGKRANADTCGVTYGNHSRNQLKELNPNYVIDSFKTLIDIV